MSTTPGAATKASGPAPSTDIQTFLPQIQFDRKASPPQAPLYLQQNDQLLLILYGNNYAIRVQVNYRYLTPQGEVKEGQYLFSGTSTNTTYGTIPLDECWLLSIEAIRTDAPQSSNWTFLQIHVMRQGTPVLPIIAHSLLWQGFLSGYAPNGYPGTPSKEVTDGPGTLRSIFGTQPIAGSEINEAVTAYRRWKLLTFRAILNTSATVANRNAGYVIDDSVNTTFAVQSSTAQTASQTKSYQLAPGCQYYNDTVSATLLPAPSHVTLKSNYHISTSTANLQASDQWSAPQYVFLEWGTWDY